ncbi:unnamed protein product [Schistosoma mattheei]|uniref:Uncharacterized protein n=1 Tax=Schistosoma mattheei TaxID=31246 RepID=A0A3P8GK31_9TREM|nr:unnamed protein product [Schistosoma mattheei]
MFIKRTPDGNTFVGHKDLKEELWVIMNFFIVNDIE